MPQEAYLFCALFCHHLVQFLVLEVKQRDAASRSILFEDLFTVSQGLREVHYFGGPLDLEV